MVRAVMQQRDHIGFDQEVKMHDGTINDRRRLGLVVVVPAALIREMVQLVPPGP